MQCAVSILYYAISCAYWAVFIIKCTVFVVCNVWSGKKERQCSNFGWRLRVVKITQESYKKSGTCAVYIPILKNWIKIRRKKHVNCHVSHITGNMSHVPCHLSCVTCHHVDCHLSPVTWQQLHATSSAMTVSRGLVMRLRKVSW